jgi:hypothetical protein
MTRRALFSTIAAAFSWKLAPAVLPASGIAIAHEAKEAEHAAARAFYESVPPPTAEEWRFYAGEHWPPEILAERQSQGRPCLVFNRIRPIVTEVVARRQIKVPSRAYDGLVADTVRMCRDSQLAYDYLRSAQAEEWRIVTPARMIFRCGGSGCVHP